MKGLKLYLEGPGQERRPVTFDSMETASSIIGSRGHREAQAIEINVLVDADGNLARQVDRDGVRYKFTGSEIPWALTVG